MNAKSDRRDGISSSHSGDESVDKISVGDEGQDHHDL